MSDDQFTPGGIAALACLLEVAAPKPGNVHRGADFEDVTFVDFATSAVVLGSVIDSWSDRSLGQTVLAAVTQTMENVGTNTNLGIVLLIVPLAKLVGRQPQTALTAAAVQKFLANLTESDGYEVFEAIRTASPGGLGNAAQLDINSETSERINLLEAMNMAATRDAVARQYATGFHDVFELGIPLLIRGRELFSDLSQAIVYAHVAWMAKEPDSLIARKCGSETAKRSQVLACQAIDCLGPIVEGPCPHPEGLEAFWTRVSDLDFWLRSDGHRRNPGTTADLIAASLYAAIHNRVIQPPYK